MIKLPFFKKKALIDETKRKNVIIITVDGLRADSVHHCQELAITSNKGVYFSNVITAAPYTIGSMHATFSSLYPSKNGVSSYFNMNKFRAEKCKTFTQYLKEQKYYTVADVLNARLIPGEGFDEVFVHEEDKGNLLGRHSKILENVRKKKNFFVYFHYSHIHNQLVENIAQKYDDFSSEYFNNKEKNRERYNGFVRETNYYIKGILKKIDELEMMKDTIVVLHSDHGCSCGEKTGEKMYGSFTYDYTIKTFALFLGTDEEAKKITQQVRTIDIMPTLLEILHLEHDLKFTPLQGQSLLPIIAGKEKVERIAFTETGGLNGPWPSPGEHNVFSIRLENKKIIFNKTPGTWEYYDLNEDPEENKNIFDKDNQEIQKKMALLLKIMEENSSV